MEAHDTCLKRKLNEFGEMLIVAISVVCILVWIMNYKYFFSWDTIDGWSKTMRFSFEKCTYYFKIVVSLADDAIPEGFFIFII